MLPDNISTGDIPMLQSIKKKLGFTFGRLMSAQSILDDENLTSDERARKLLKIGPDEDINLYMRSKLNDEEIALMKRIIGI